jgi:hypothetical protein
MHCPGGGELSGRGICSGGAGELKRGGGVVIIGLLLHWLSEASIDRQQPADGVEIQEN